MIGPDSGARLRSPTARRLSQLSQPLLRSGGLAAALGRAGRGARAGWPRRLGGLAAALGLTAALEESLDERGLPGVL
jgi:hypothetical protein